MELTNGAIIKFDWYVVSEKEKRMLFDKQADEEANDIVVGKIVGMTADELTDLNPIDYRKVIVGLFESLRNGYDTTSSKNSVGESTSD